MSENLNYFILIAIISFNFANESVNSRIQNPQPIPNIVNYIKDSGKNIELPVDIKERLFKELNILRDKFLKELDYENVLNTFTISTSNYYRSYNEQKSIKLDKYITKVRPTWDEVLDFYGGIANLAGQEINNKQISKDNIAMGHFDLEVYIKEISITDVDDCEISIYYKGDSRQLNFHGVKSYETQRGFYEISERTDYNQMNVFELIKKAQKISNSEDIPFIIFEIPGNRRFFDDLEHETLITDILYKDLISKMKDFLNDLNFVVENIIDQEIFNNIPYISDIIRENNIRYDQNLLIIGKTNDVEKLEKIEVKLQNFGLIKIVQDKIKKINNINNQSIIDSLMLIYDRHKNLYSNSINGSLELTLPLPLFHFRGESMANKNAWKIDDYWYEADDPFVKKNIDKIHTKILNEPNNVTEHDILKLGLQKTSGINIFLGYTEKRFYKPIVPGQWNNYWHYGSVILYYPYIGIGSDYVFKNGYFFGFNTFYIVPSITFGKYF